MEASANAISAAEKESLAGKCEPCDTGVIVENKVTFKRIVGIPAGISFVVGSIIGSGIFATPKYVLLYSGSVGLSFVVWFLGGVISLFGALCYAELGAMIPRSGSVYNYLNEAFGPLPAFLYIWISVFFCRPGDVILLLVFGAYVIEPIFPGCNASQDFLPLQKLIAAATLGVITFLNCMANKWSTRFIMGLTVTKMVAIAILIVTGILRLAQGYTSSFENSMEGSTTDIGMIGLAFYSAMFSYGGCENLNAAAEEMKNPKRDFPLCLWISLPMVMVCYILVNVGYLSVLSPSELLQSEALAVTLANQLFGVMAWIMPVLISCSIFGAYITFSFGSSRILNTAARNGHFPPVLAMINRKTRTPIPALVLQAILSCILLMPEGNDFQSLLQYTSFLVWSIHLSAVSCLLWMRYRRPDAPRPYKVRIICPVLMFLVCLYMVITPLYNAPLESFYWVLLILTGVPVYFIFVKYKPLPKEFYSWAECVTYKLQVALDLAIPNEDDLSKTTDQEEHQKMIPGINSYANG